MTNAKSRKTPWKLSPTRKANARSRLKKVDSVIEAVRASGVNCAALVSNAVSFPFCDDAQNIAVQNRALELPKEHEMPARDKYTVFSPHARGYRKGIHKVPKWTRVGLIALFYETFTKLYVPVDAQNQPQRFLDVHLARKRWMYYVLNKLKHNYLDFTVLDTLYDLRMVEHSPEGLVPSLGNFEYVPILCILVCGIKNDVGQGRNT